MPNTMAAESWIVPADVAVPVTEYSARPSPGQSWKLMEPVTWDPDCDSVTTQRHGAATLSHATGLCQLPAKLVTCATVGVAVGATVGVAVGAVVGVAVGSVVGTGVEVGAAVGTEVDVAAGGRVAVATAVAALVVAVADWVGVWPAVAAVATAEALAEADAPGEAVFAGVGGCVWDTGVPVPDAEVVDVAVPPESDGVLSSSLKATTAHQLERATTATTPPATRPIRIKRERAAWSPLIGC